MMALTTGDETYTKLTHLENGKVFVRRIKRLEVQARNGRLYVITGKDLPDYIQTSTGEGRKGDSLTQILLSGKDSPYNFKAESPAWPSARDVLNLVIGFCLIGMFKFIHSLFSQTF